MDILMYLDSLSNLILINNIAYIISKVSFDGRLEKLEIF